MLKHVSILFFLILLCGPISYSTATNQKFKKEKPLQNLVAQDSIASKIKGLEEKMNELSRMKREIENDRLHLYDQQRKIAYQRRLLSKQNSRISLQRNALIIAGVLAIFILILIIFLVRNNRQRAVVNLRLSRQKREIEHQKHLAEVKQKEILDSINYAKRIQRAVLPHNKYISEHLKDYFIMYRPKDIVAGDFYWASRVLDSLIFATGDSTGHGVPGAFMSLLNMNKLNEVVNQHYVTRPDIILNYVRDNVIAALNPPGSTEDNYDGMDVILCNLNLNNLKLQYAAANSNFCVVRGREIINLKADKMPVGKSIGEARPFKLNEIQLQKGDVIYTYTDGYGDQFGGPKGKKFKHSLLREIFVKIVALPFQLQKQMLEKQLEDWQGDLEQVDDILIIGIRV